jgi:hypothetical protein
MKARVPALDINRRRVARSLSESNERDSTLLSVGFGGALGQGLDLLDTKTNSCII